MPVDERKQALYEELRRRGVFKTDARKAALVQELIKRGELRDASQPRAPRPSAPVGETVDSYAQKWLSGARPKASPAKKLDELVRSPESSWSSRLKGYSPVGVQALTREARRLRSGQRERLEAMGRETLNPAARIAAGFAGAASGGAVWGAKDIELAKETLSRGATSAVTGVPAAESIPGGFFPSARQQMEREGGFVPTAIGLAAGLADPASLSDIALSAPLGPLGRGVNLALGVPFAATGVPAAVEAARRGDPGGAAAAGIFSALPFAHIPGRRGGGTTPNLAHEAMIESIAQAARDKAALRRLEGGRVKPRTRPNLSEAMKPTGAPARPARGRLPVSTIRAGGRTVVSTSRTGRTEAAPSGVIPGRKAPIPTTGAKGLPIIAGRPGGIRDTGVAPKKTYQPIPIIGEKPAPAPRRTRATRPKPAPKVEVARVERVGQPRTEEQPVSPTKRAYQGPGVVIEPPAPAPEPQGVIPVTRPSGPRPEASAPTGTVTLRRGTGRRQEVRTVPASDTDTISGMQADG